MPRGRHETRQERERREAQQQVERQRRLDRIAQANARNIGNSAMVDRPSDSAVVDQLDQYPSNRNDDATMVIDPIAPSLTMPEMADVMRELGSMSSISASLARSNPFGTLVRHSGSTDRVYSWGTRAATPLPTAPPSTDTPLTGEGASQDTPLTDTPLTGALAGDDVVINWGEAPAPSPTGRTDPGPAWQDLHLHDDRPLTFSWDRIDTTPIRPGMNINASATSAHNPARPISPVRTFTVREDRHSGPPRSGVAFVEGGTLALSAADIQQRANDALRENATAPLADDNADNPDRWAGSGEWPEDVEIGVEIAPENPLTNPAPDAILSTSEDGAATGQRQTGIEGAATMVGISTAARLLGVDRQRLHYLRECGALRVEARPTNSGSGVRYFVDLEEARQALNTTDTWVQRNRRPSRVGNGVTTPLANSIPATPLGPIAGRVDPYGNTIANPDFVTPASDAASYQPVGIRNANRKFGVEMEVMLRSTYGLIDAMRAEGLDCEYEGYNHTARPHWKIVTDGSLSSHVSGYQGYEIVSPPLSGEAGLLQVKKACRALRAVQAKVNKTCGMHVHHDVSEVRDVAFFKRLIRNYRDSIQPIEAVLAPSRRHNTPGRSSYAAVWDTSAMRRIDQCYSVGELHGVLGRYYAINLCALNRQGTVEFRQHHGTVDADKVINWIKFGQAMIDEAINGATIAANDAQGLGMALAFTPMTLDYWQQRSQELTNPRSTTRRRRAA